MADDEQVRRGMGPAPDEVRPCPRCHRRGVATSIGWDIRPNEYLREVFDRACPCGWRGPELSVTRWTCKISMAEGVRAIPGSAGVRDMACSSIPADRFRMGRSDDYWPSVRAYMATRVSEVRAAGVVPDALGLVRDTRLHFAFRAYDTPPRGPAAGVTGADARHRARWAAAATDAIRETVRAEETQSERAGT